MLGGGFQNLFKIPELKKRIFITLALLSVYRIGVHVPTPGIDRETLADILSRPRFKASKASRISSVERPSESILCLSRANKRVYGVGKHLVTYPGLASRRTVPLPDKACI